MPATNWASKSPPVISHTLKMPDGTTQPAYFNFIPDVFMGNSA